MEQFRYSPLEPGSIRLLKLLPESTSSDIRCEIQHQLSSGIRCDIQHWLSTGTRMGYVALSYCWGDPKPIADIIINGQLMRIAENLHAWFQALHSLPESSDIDTPQDLKKQWFWMDAICINQDDVVERNAQVQEMWRVYSDALFVLSWLGPPTTLISDAFDCVEAIEDVPCDMMDSVTSAICDGLDSSGYFDRVWIVSELLGARPGNSVWLMLGSRLLSWEHVSLYMDEGPGRAYDDSLPSGCRGIIALAWQEEESRFRRDFNKLERFLNHLRALSKRNCTDIRDKTFALLAVPQTQDALKYIDYDCLVVDYNLTIEEVCIMTIASVEQIDRTDQQKFQSNAFLHRDVLDIVSESLDIDLFEVQDWLRAAIVDDEIRLTTGKRITPGAMLLDLVGDAMLLGGEDPTEAYEEHLARVYGPGNWRGQEVPLGGTRLARDHGIGKGKTAEYTDPFWDLPNFRKRPEAPGRMRNRENFRHHHHQDD